MDQVKYNTLIEALKDIPDPRQGLCKVDNLTKKKTIGILHKELNNGGRYQWIKSSITRLLRP